LIGQWRVGSLDDRVPTAARRPTGVEPSAIANLMASDEARKIPNGIAKLPELLLKGPQNWSPVWCDILRIATRRIQGDGRGWRLSVP
jgi:hypothetical protein